MKRNFKYHPDNLIIINSGKDQYLDSIDRFAYDCAKTDLPLIPIKSEKITEYFINSEGLSYAIEGNDRQVGLKEAGINAESFYIYIDNLDKLLAAKQERDNPKKGKE